MNIPLDELFGEGTKTSMMRFLNFLITGVVMFNWSVINWTNAKNATGEVEMTGLDPMSLTLVMGTLGMKLGQKAIEVRGKKDGQVAPNYKIIMQPTEEKIPG